MLKIAAAQMEPQLLDLEANIKKVDEMTSQASQLGVEIIVFPECALTGYVLTREEAEFISEPIPGPATDQLVKISREKNILITIGLLEKDQEGRCFNTAVLLGAGGILGQYRKTHLPCLGVDRFLMPGKTINGPHETPIGRVGLLICYDLRFPEPIRVLALRKTQVVLLPTAWPSAASLYPEFLARTRAAENCLYLIAANRIGEERGTSYLGRSVIAGPEGEMLVEGSSVQEELLLAELDLERSDQKAHIFKPGEYEFDLFGDRRPELYRSIVEESNWSSEE
jgi:predicted amidohydrolase